MLGHPASSLTVDADTDVDSRNETEDALLVASLGLQ